MEELSKEKRDAVFNDIFPMAKQSYENGFGEMALIFLQDLPDLEEHSEALLLLCDIYSEGKGIEPDYKKALYYFEKAYKTGDTISDYKRKTENLTMLYFASIANLSPKEIFDKANELYDYVYHKDNDIGFTCVELNFYAGYATTFLKSDDIGFALYRAAAEIGQYKVSQSMLCNMYFSGTGTEKNLLAAMYWGVKVSHNNTPLYGLGPFEEIGISTMTDMALANVVTSLKKECNQDEALFAQKIRELVSYCETGECEDIPKDEEMADILRKKYNL